MTRPYARPDPPGSVLDAPAAERNKEPILAVLRRRLPASGRILEVASGTGQHVMHFARALPGLTWIPSDPDAGCRESILARRRREAPGNVREPVFLDVLHRPWPVTRADGVVCINMIHIAPPQAAGALLAGSAEVLAEGGVLYLYGPYRRFGAHTAPSNEAFDAALKARNAEWGIRDLEAVEELAAGAGLILDEVVDMPANNLSVLFRRRSLP